MGRVIEKYLNRYSESLPEISGLWDSGVLIPARSELDDLLICIDSLTTASFNKKNLAVLVINGQVTDIESNQQSWDQISSLGNYEDLSADSRLIKRGALDILLINRFKDSYVFNETEGVGHARKLGADLILSLIFKKQIKSPWIRSTDADIIAPKNYFSDDDSMGRNISARIFSFFHSLSEDPVLNEAVKSYEGFLHYYKNGLKFAKSPYAQYCIGSTLCIHAEAYANVRGFPKRLAGEDFYLINKIVKIGAVIDDPAIRLELRGRISERTPFGTGQSLKLISEKIRNQNEYTVYHPSIFEELKKLIELFKEASSTQSIEKFFSEENLGTKLFVACSTLDIFSELIRLHKSNSSDLRRLRSFHTYFDGLKTLRLINILRDQTYPSMSLGKAEEDMLMKSHEYSSINGRRNPPVYPQSRYS